jgi:hypothetical protein
VCSFADLHAHGLPAGADLHAYVNLDYTEEEVVLSHEHLGEMPEIEALAVDPTGDGAALPEGIEGAVAAGLSCMAGEEYYQNLLDFP